MGDYSKSEDTDSVGSCTLEGLWDDVCTLVEPGRECLVRSSIRSGSVRTSRAGRCRTAWTGRSGKRTRGGWTARPLRVSTTPRLVHTVQGHEHDCKGGGGHLRLEAEAHEAPHNLGISGRVGRLLTLSEWAQPVRALRRPYRMVAVITRSAVMAATSQLGDKPQQHVSHHVHGKLTSRGLGS